MSIKKKQSQTPSHEPPRLARHSANRQSTLKTGRTLSVKREKLETSSERVAAHQRLKRKERQRFVVTIIGFAVVAAIVITIGVALSRPSEEVTTESTTSPTIIYKPTIEVIDENTGGNVTSRMREYIGQAEIDFQAYGLVPVKAVIPSGAIREVDFYLDGHSGFIKMILDRDTAVSAEDAYRMIRYLEGQGITDYQYIDVRLPGRAYWK